MTRPKSFRVRSIREWQALLLIRDVGFYSCLEKFVVNSDRTIIIQRPVFDSSPSCISAACCSVSWMNHVLFSAILVNWEFLPLETLSPQASEALRSLRRMNVAVKEDEWIALWNKFLCRLKTREIDSLGRISKASKIIQHLKTCAPSGLSEWLVCEAGLEKYRSKLQAPIRPEHMKVDCQHTSCNPNSENRDDSRHLSGMVLASPTQGCGDMEAKVFLLCAPTRDRDDPNCIVSRLSGPCRQVRGGEYHAQPMNHINLSEQSITLLVGWYLLGQRENIDTWIKTFCVILASVAESEKLGD